MGIKLVVLLVGAGILGTIFLDLGSRADGEQKREAASVNADPDAARDVLSSLWDEQTSPESVEAESGLEAVREQAETLDARLELNNPDEMKAKLREARAQHGISYQAVVDDLQQRFERGDTPGEVSRWLERTAEHDGFERFLRQGRQD